MAGEKTRLIRANVTGPYRRGGLDLSGGREVLVKDSELTKAELKALEADPRVTLGDGPTEKAPTKKAGAKKKAAASGAKKAPASGQAKEPGDSPAAPADGGQSTESKETDNTKPAE